MFGMINNSGLAPFLDTNQSLDDFIDLLSPPSDMENFMSMEAIEEVRDGSLSSILPDILEDVGISDSDQEDFKYDMETNQSLINEVEQYLQSVESTSSTTLEESWSDLNAMNVKDEQMNAENIFKALTSGNVMTDSGLTESDLENAFTTSVVGQDGENVIIIIAPPSPCQDSKQMVPVDSMMSPMSTSSPVPSPGGSGAENTGDNDSDADWSPESAYSLNLKTVNSAARKKYQRKNRPTPPSGLYPKEKGERKKAQNRSAAFKYREKKKAEQEAVDGELDALYERNQTLKRKMSDMEIELKCLKKLMKETGLGMYLRN